MTPPDPRRRQSHTSLAIRLGSTLLCLLTAVTGVARASDYSLKIVARTGDLVNALPLTALVGPSLNDLGDVVYLGAFQNSDDTVSILHVSAFDPLRQSKLLLADRATIGSQTVCGFSTLVVNDQGTVAFEVTSYSDPNAGCENEEVYSTSVNRPGQFNLLASAGDIVGGQYLSSPDFYGFNDAGTASILGNNNIFLARASRRDPTAKQLPLVTLGSKIAGKTLIDFGSVPTLNDAGTLCFIGTFKRGSGIFTQRSLLAQTGETIDGQTLDAFISIPKINDFGTAVFLAGIQNLSAGQVGVFTQSKLLAKTGDTIGGHTLAGLDEYMSEPAIDDLGQAYFEAQLSDGNYGIFTPSALIVETGDTVGGKTLAGISEMSANKLGALAFRGLFTDGSQAIVLAQPRLPYPQP